MMQSISSRVCCCSADEEILYTSWNWSINSKYLIGSMWENIMITPIPVDIIVSPIHEDTMVSTMHGNIMVSTIYGDIMVSLYMGHIMVSPTREEHESPVRKEHNGKSHTCGT